MTTVSTLLRKLRSLPNVSQSRIETDVRRSALANFENKPKLKAERLLRKRAIVRVLEGSL